MSWYGDSEVAFLATASAAALAFFETVSAAEVSLTVTDGAAVAAGFDATLVGLVEVLERAMAEVDADGDCGRVEFATKGSKFLSWRRS